MDHIVVYEAVEIQKPEFRLYYDDSGKVLFYSCEKPEGNFIVIDAETYAAGRPDVRIIDGKISKVTPNAVVSKLMPNTTEGQLCCKEDVSIITNIEADAQRWKLMTYEL